MRDRRGVMFAYRKPLQKQVDVGQSGAVEVMFAYRTIAVSRGVAPSES